MQIPFQMSNIYLELDSLSSSDFFHIDLIAAVSPELSQQKIMHSFHAIDNAKRSMHFFGRFIIFSK